MKHPRLWCRNGSYYFRCKVPNDLLTHYRGRKLIQRSLNTHDPREAKRLVILESAKQEEEFAVLRANTTSVPQRFSGVPQPIKITEISDELIESLHGRLIHADLLTDDNNRESGFDFEVLGGIERDEHFRGMREFYTAMKQALGDGKLELAEGSLHSFLWLCGLEVSREVPGYRKLLKSHSEALVRSFDAKFRRAEGEVVRANDLAAYPLALPREQEVSSQHIKEQAPSSALHLSKVIQHFLEDEAGRGIAAMMQKHHAVMPMFLEFVGDKPIASVKQTDLMGFFALVHKLPPRWKDIQNKKKLSLSEIAAMQHPKKIAEATFTGTYRASISVFLDWGVANYQDQGFPTTCTLNKVDYRGSRMKGEYKQRAFTIGELQLLYTGTEMSHIAADPDQAARYWLCHIGLFTGARINEICQLNPQTDILQDPSSGIWYFWFTAETEAAEGVTKIIKTKKSRQVPIHRTLIELGILEYVRQMKETHAKLIFPYWKPQGGRASPNAERWFTRHLKAIRLHGVENKNGFAIRGSHAFRHSLLSYGKRPPFYLNLRCISGHAEKNDTNDNYFSENKVAEGYEDETITTPLSEKKQLLDRLDYGITFITPIAPSK